MATVETVLKLFCNKSALTRTGLALQPETHIAWQYAAIILYGAVGTSTNGELGNGVLYSQNTLPTQVGTDTDLQKIPVESFSPWE